MIREKFGRITDNEVYEAIEKGDIIEKYWNDKPYPSFLILGKTSTGRPLHVVCAYNENDKLAIIVTVYHPDPDLWEEYKRRRKK